MPVAIQKITIEEFLRLAELHPIFDVRSPGEYTHAHIPSAYSLPLFSDEERKVVGTAYKQESRETAIKIGLDYFGAKMKKIVEEAELIVQSHKSGVRNVQTTDSKPFIPNAVLIHCWRGGMRSAGVAWLLDLYGFKVYTLVGGYKVFRKWTLHQFEKEYAFNIIGGYTGSGKTLLLHELKKKNRSIVDLEALANHKGSAFGGMGPQPSQEMFENVLAVSLNKKGLTPTYMEDESQRIGNLQIPIPLWNTIRKSPVFFVDIPFEKRLEYITLEYGRQEKEKLVNAVIRIQKRLGGLETKNAINFLLEDNIKESFRILLKYYDKWYGKALLNRENLSSLLNKIPCLDVDTTTNVQKILECNIVNA